MDNIWIFLVIIGAVISMVQKNQQKNRPAEQNSDPTLDPQAEWERRMQEIFGEQKSTTPAPEQIPTPTATQTPVLCRLCLQTNPAYPRLRSPYDSEED